MLSEPEILSQHQASLRQARERCLALHKQLVETSPRGRHHIQLREACKRLEGTCRQMGHYRGDFRWFSLGGVYAKAWKKADEMFVGNRWAGFGELAKLFEQGIRKADDLATRRTEKKGTLILPPSMMQ